MFSGYRMKVEVGTPQVSVIIPTMASSERGAMLQRAVISIRASSNKPICIIAVVNGNRFDATVCDWLKAQSDVQFEYITEPSAPGAILRGRELVKTEFFSTLDDDDEYLLNMTDEKLAVLQADPHADLLVANVFHCLDGVDSLLYERLIDVKNSPVECLMRFNWLHNGNALYRSSSVGLVFFRDYHPYAEWTLVAFRLALAGKKVAVLDRPAFRWNDTAASLSKSQAYFQSYIPLFRRMLALSPPQQIVRMIHRKMGAAYHDASVAALRDGRRLDAWRDHLQSLFMTGGLSFLSYTRHLFK